MATQNPLLYGILKASASVKARRSGASRSDVQTAADSVDGDMIDEMVAEITPAITYPTFAAKVGSGGTILAELLAFLQTPEGQQIVAALMQLLLSLIAGG